MSPVGQPQRCRGVAVQPTCSRPRWWDMLTHLHTSCKTNEEAPGHLQPGVGLAAPLGEEGRMPASTHPVASERFSLPTDSLRVFDGHCAKETRLYCGTKDQNIPDGSLKKAFLFVPDCKEACRGRRLTVRAAFRVSLTTLSPRSSGGDGQDLWKKPYLFKGLC